MSAFSFLLLCTLLMTPFVIETCLWLHFRPISPPADDGWRHIVG